jgi:hypothetical protein
VSSTYRILCLSHDPAITTGDYSSPEAAAAAITAGVDEHPHCDLLIGRYSAALVEVGCPPSLSKRPGQYRCHTHASTEWAGTAWLRILAAVHQSGDDKMRALASDSHLRHWPWERLRRLRGELGFAMTDHPQEQDSEEPSGV